MSQNYTDYLSPHETTFSREDVLNAMCALEHINEVTLPNQPTTNENWVAYRDDVGSWELRYQSIALGRYAAAVYALVEEDLRSYNSFDFEAVPAILDALEWDGDPGQGTFGYTLPTLEVMAAKLTNYFDLTRFRYECNDALKLGYGIDFTNDAGMTEQEFEDAYWAVDPAERMTPQEVAGEYARKHDLTPRSMGLRP